MYKTFQKQKDNSLLVREVDQPVLFLLDQTV